MPKKNPEIVRAAIEAWNRLDDDAAFELVSPDAVLDASGRVLNPETYTGVDGFLRFRRDIGEAWDRFEVQVEDVFESGDLVVVFVRSVGVGRASGVQVDLRSAWLMTVSDQKITGLRLYRERDEALEAAGLPKPA